MTGHGVLPPSLSATPKAVARTFTRLVLSGEFAAHARSSVMRLGLAVFLGSILGIGTGLLLSQLRLMRHVFSPTLRFLAPIPVIVWMPFVVAFVGTGESYKITMVAVCTFFIMQGHSFDGGIAVSNRYLELARIYGKPLHQRIMTVILPAASPLIFSGLRLSLALAWVVLMFVEFGSARLGSEGMGWFVADARALGKVEEEYAGVFLIALLGLGTDTLAAWMCARSSRWLVPQETN